MNTILLNFNGKTIESNLRFSLNKEPNYFWCYLNDTELTSKLGTDCILFINHNGKLKTPHYYPTEYKTLIYNLESSIREYIGMRDEDKGE